MYFSHFLFQIGVPRSQQSQQHITAKADNGFADTSPNGALPNVAISQRPGQDAKIGMRIEILGSQLLQGVPQTIVISRV